MLLIGNPPISHWIKNNIIDKLLNKNKKSPQTLLFYSPDDDDERY